MSLTSYIPEWTSIRVPVWAVHRDPRYFSRPDEFFPDRWLIGEGLQEYEGSLAHTPNAFIPFSVGPFNCVGKNLAMLEMKMLVTHMMQRLELRFQDGFDPASWERDMEDRFNLNLGKLPVVAEQRL